MVQDAKERFVAMPASDGIAPNKYYRYVIVWSSFRTVQYMAEESQSHILQCNGFPPKS